MFFFISSLVRYLGKVWFSGNWTKKGQGFSGYPGGGGGLEPKHHPGGLIFRIPRGGGGGGH